MRPRLYTFRNFLLLLAAVCIFGGLAFWIKSGMPLPGVGVPSTAGKLAFVSDRDGGHNHLWMMNGADGANAVGLTSGGADDSEPAWSPDGSTLAFILRQGTDDPQVYEVDAKAGSKSAGLTHTTSSKDKPMYGTENRIFYLSGGKVTATVADGSDTDLIFPTAEQVRSLTGTDENESSQGILTMGGIADAKPSPDGGRLAISLKTEHGVALLMYDISKQECVVLGVAHQAYFSFLPDGRLAVIFANGSPLREAVMLFNADAIKSGATVPAHLLNNLPAPETSAVAIYDAAGAVSVFHALPFAPDNVAFSPNGDQLAFGVAKPPVANTPGPAPGVVLVALDSGQATPVYDKAAGQIVYSPDGKKVAFVGDGDIFVAATDGSGGEAKNLTSGHGKNSEPVWSPAKPAK